MKLTCTKIPQNRATPVYVFACVKKSFVDIATPPVFAMPELMSDDFCVANEAPTPPPPALFPGVIEGPLISEELMSDDFCVANEAPTPPPPALFPGVIEGPLISESVRYIHVFKQRSSYDTVVTEELFFDKYLTVEYKPPNDRCMHTKLWDDIKNSNSHEKESMRIPLMPYKRFMKRHSI
jgi:hypothetical protein